MNLLNFLRRQFQYEFWANRLEIETLSATTVPPGSAVGRLAHILAAQGLWLDRLEGKLQRSAVWPGSSLQDCASEAAKLEAAWQSYLGALTEDGLGARCAYTNSKGERWENSVLDILSHVLLHSAYHRGQVAVDVRQAGLEPAYTDYIHAVRQGLMG